VCEWLGLCAIPNAITTARTSSEHAEGPPSPQDGGPCYRLTATGTAVPLYTARGWLPGHGFRDTPAGYGYDVTVDGTVEVPDVPGPVLLMTWAYWPMPPSETTNRSWNFTPGVFGTSNPWSWMIVGSVVKLQ
jgi:hypothetical protein